MVTLAPKIDLYALFILLGIAQGFFLSFFFWKGNTKIAWANRFLGLTILALSFILLEIFLCYSNLMFQALWLIDFSEPLNLVVGPCYYFFVRQRLLKPFRKIDWLHFLPFLLWGLYAISWFMQDNCFKYNAYINAYHPDLEFLSCPDGLFKYYDFLAIRQYTDYITITSLGIYCVLVLMMVYKSYPGAFQRLILIRDKNYSWLSWTLIHILSIYIIVLLIKLFYYNDLGDHFIAVYGTIIIYSNSFFIIQQSQFFRVDSNASDKPKYQKSSLNEAMEDELIQRLEKLMQEKKPHLRNDLSLSILARELHISRHHLSQILNDKLALSFFDFVAKHRIEEAQAMLISPEMQHLKIEEIAERVGYNSKSAFNAAFKKWTSETPSAYRKRLLS